jgi:hypothetical protein
MRTSITDIVPITPIRTPQLHQRKKTTRSFDCSQKRFNFQSGLIETNPVMPGKSKSKSSPVFATKKRTQRKRNQAKPTSPSKFPESSEQSGTIEIERQSSGQLMQEETVASSPGIDQVATPCNTGIERVDGVLSGVDGDEPAPSTKLDSPGAEDRGCGSSTPVEVVEPLRNASEDTNAIQCSSNVFAKEAHASVL